MAKRKNSRRTINARLKVYLVRWMDRLTEKQQAVANLYIIENLTARQTAVLLGTNKGNVLTQMYKIKKQLLKYERIGRHYARCLANEREANFKKHTLSLKEMLDSE